MTLPLRLGGMGFTSATRIRGSAHWGSWADCLPMIHARHPDVATALIQQLNGQPVTPCLREAQEAASGVSRATGWVPPSWNEFAAGARPEVIGPDQFELWDPQRGWQHEAASRIEAWWLDEFVFPRMEEFARALVRSQGGVRRRSGVESVPQLQSHPVGTATIQGPPLAPSPIAPSFVRAFMPVWPPTRSVWPPPRCLCTGRDLGQDRIGS